MFVLSAQSSFLQSDVLLALKSSRALTDAEKALLHTEITGDPQQRGYVGLADAELLVVLCSPYQQANPAPQGRIPVATISGDDLRGFLAIAFTTASMSPDPKVQAWVPRLPALTTFITNVINLADPTFGQLVQGYVMQAIADGVFTQANWDALTTLPDPAYQSTLLFASRADSVLGLYGVVLELSDVAGLR